MQIDQDAQGQRKGYQYQILHQPAALAGLLRPFFPTQGGSGGGFNIDFG